MINLLVNKRPGLKFDNYKENYKVVQQNEVVKIWVDNIFNQNTFDFSLNSAGLTFNKISNYEYDVTADSVGYHTLHLTISNRDKVKSIVSKSLLLIVV